MWQNIRCKKLALKNGPLGKWFLRSRLPQNRDDSGILRSDNIIIVDFDLVCRRYFVPTYNQCLSCIFSYLSSFVEAGMGARVLVAGWGDKGVFPHKGDEGGDFRWMQKPHAQGSCRLLPPRY